MFPLPGKNFPGHKCNPPQFLLLVDNDDQVDGQADAEQPPLSTDPTHDPLSNPYTHDVPPPQFLFLSPAAAFGINSPRTFRVKGTINNHPVTILIDSGSTHNIIQPRLAALLHIPSTPITPFPVMVGSGDSLHCEGFCPDIKLTMNYTTFSIPSFILSVAGAELVLGLA